jgi:hypothetical protein
MHLSYKLLLQISFLGILFGLLSTSCTPEQRKRMEVTPTAYGSIDQLYLVCDEYFWEESEVGDTFRMHFEALYPVLPQPEPILDVRHIPSQDFNKVLKTHRAIIIMADLSDEDDPSTILVRQALGDTKIRRAREDERYRMAVHRDRWAKGQTVIYWFAPNRQSLFETVARDYKRALDIIREADSEKLLKQVYFPGETEEVNERILADYNFELSIPKGFKIAHRDSVAMWLRKETNKVSTNIFMYCLENPEPNTLSPDSLKAIRNRLTKDYFSTWVEDSYMQIDDKNLPVYYQEIQFGLRKALQARGIWYMENDFMGGPFVTYFIPDPDNNRIVILDGFVHAPGQKKRPEMRKLDTVFSTFKLEPSS